MAAFWRRLKSVQAILFVVFAALVLFVLNMVAGHYASSPQIDALYKGTIRLPEANFNSLQLTLDSKVMASSIIVDLLTMVFVVACLIFLFRLGLICVSYVRPQSGAVAIGSSKTCPPGTVRILAIVAVLFGASYLFLSLWSGPGRVLGVRTGTFLLIAHQRPAGLIENYCECKHSFRIETVKTADNKAISMKTAVLNGAPTSRGSACELSSQTYDALFLLSAVLGVSVVGTILFVAGASLTPLDRFTAKALSADVLVKMPRRRTKPSPTSASDDYINKLTIEFRKRTEELESIFGFGAILLFIAIGWMAARVKWASPLIVEMHGPAALSILNGYIVYLAVTYSAVLFLAYAPQMFLLHKQFRDRYYDTETGTKKDDAGEKNDTIVGFADWLEKNHLSASVLTARDLIPMLVPFVSLLLSGALELSSIKEIAAGLR